ncbi:MAG: hypothetical protein JNK77_18040 [Saprospiraceae bacterium]|nr:hypothetical protein [Saprospiraceae bacterium]
MESEDLKTTAELITHDFEMPEPAEDLVSEAQLLEMLSERIADLIEHRMEFLLSLMYRLDVNERKVHAALSPLAPEPPHIGIARLVVERQKQRAFTKRYYQQQPLDDEMEEW